MIHEQSNEDNKTQQKATRPSWSSPLEEARKLVDAVDLRQPPYRGTVTKVATLQGTTRANVSLRLKRGDPRTIAMIAGEIRRIDRQMDIEMRYAMEVDQ